MFRINIYLCNLFRYLCKTWWIIVLIMFLYSTFQNKLLLTVNFISYFRKYMYVDFVVNSLQVNLHALRQHEARHRQDGPYKCDIKKKWLFRSTFTKHTCSVIPLNASTNVNAVNRSRHLMIQNALNKERAKQRNSNVMNVAWPSLIIKMLVKIRIKISTRIENVINVLIIQV
jgi:hypothetical protein